AIVLCIAPTFRAAGCARPGGGRAGPVVAECAGCCSGGVAPDHTVQRRRHLRRSGDWRGRAAFSAASCFEWRGAAVLYRAGRVAGGGPQQGQPSGRGAGPHGPRSAHGQLSLARRRHGEPCRGARAQRLGRRRVEPSGRCCQSARRFCGVWWRGAGIAVGGGKPRPLGAVPTSGGAALARR
ncbi:unnamed protein product, partial [Laminaria digitata]